MAPIHKTIGDLLLFMHEVLCGHSLSSHLPESATPKDNKEENIFHLQLYYRMGRAYFL